MKKSIYSQVKVRGVLPDNSKNFSNFTPFYRPLPYLK